MKERLQKYLARAGVASRRQAERLIEEGHVKVNGRIVRELGTSVEANVDVIEFAGRRIELDTRRVYLLVYKPQKVITSVSDPEGRDVIVRLIPNDFGRVYPVGRLDWDSEGAVILTNDGDLTELLTHPRHEVPKTYMVKTTGVVTDMDPRIERLRDGVVLDDGYRTRPCEITRDSDTGKHSWFVVTIREGKNRQIRRMFEAVGLDVRRLRRIAYGPVLLGDLQPGDYRRMHESEIEELYEAAGGKRAVTTASRGRLPTTKREGKLETQREARRILRRSDAEEPRPFRDDIPEGVGSVRGPGPRSRGARIDERAPREADAPSERRPAPSERRPAPSDGTSPKGRGAPRREGAAPKGRGAPRAEESAPKGRGAQRTGRASRGSEPVAEAPASRGRAVDRSRAPAPSKERGGSSSGSAPPKGRGRRSS